MVTRRLLAVLVLATTLGAAVAAVSCGTQQDASNTAATPAMSAVERGRYLTVVTGCGDCHTPGTLYGSPDDTRILAGSEIPWGGPWGVAFAANLTPDPETGLGQWTDEQIMTAIRTGARPDGRLLAQIMPWGNFSHFTNEDLAAIVAYLRSLPPIVHAEPAPVPPNVAFTGPTLAVPPPSAWDAQHLPPPAEAPGH